MVAFQHPVPAASSSGDVHISRIKDLLRFCLGRLCFFRFFFIHVVVVPVHWTQSMYNKEDAGSFDLLLLLFLLFVCHTHFWPEKPKRNLRKMMKWIEILLLNLILCRREVVFIQPETSNHHHQPDSRLYIRIIILLFIDNDFLLFLFIQFRHFAFALMGKERNKKFTFHTHISQIDWNYDNECGAGDLSAHLYIFLVYFLFHYIQYVLRTVTLRSVSPKIPSIPLPIVLISNYNTRHRDSKY